MVVLRVARPTSRVTLRVVAGDRRSWLRPLRQQGRQPLDRCWVPWVVGPVGESPLQCASQFSDESADLRPIGAAEYGGDATTVEQREQSGTIRVIAVS
jgi:hypothetical protein